VPRRGYLRRLIQAHRLHHAVMSRGGAVSFGFLIAPDPVALHAELKRLRAERRR
jgi:beta-carotene 3-hydroxylase